jgi:multidrug efflux pump subunit AcrA (membrane-fusion protein)
MTVGCQPKTASPFIVPVSAKKIQTRNFEEVIQAQGTLSNPGYIQITPQINGLITQVLVKEGDAVNAGDILMTLNNKQELAELKTAKEELKQHIIEAKNTNYLVNNGAKAYIEI